MATVRKLKFQDRLFYIILYFLLGVFCFSTLYPFIYFLVLSLNDGQDALRGGIYLWPREFTLENYMKAFEKSRYRQFFPHFRSAHRHHNGSLGGTHSADGLWPFDQGLARAQIHRILLFLHDAVRRWPDPNLYPLSPDGVAQQLLGVRHSWSINTRSSVQRPSLMVCHPVYPSRHA